MDFSAQELGLEMKRYLISLLVKQAQSDNDFSLIEKKYLAYAGRSLGLSEAEIAAIRLNPEKYFTSPPPDESKRMTMLYFLLFMMWADGEIKAEEEKFCHHAGFCLGFRPDLVSDLISVLKVFLKNEIPPEAMLEKIKPYMN